MLVPKRKKAIFLFLLSFIFVFQYSSDGIASMKDGRIALENRNFQMAYDILLPMANNGNSEAQYLVGTLLQSDIEFINGKKNPCNWVSLRQRKPMLSKGPKDFTGTPHVRIPMPADQERNCDIAMEKWFRLAAEGGYVRAQFRLARMYSGKSTFPEDPEEVLYWTQKAADQGYSKAQGALGFYYLRGGFGEKNYDKALYWLRKAVSNGSKNFATWIGKIYQEGLGVEQNTELAITNFEKGIKYSDSSAGMYLGQLYGSGNGVRQSDIEQYKWYLITWRLTYFIPAKEKTDYLEQYMGEEEVKKAKSLAKQWLADNSLE